MTEPTAAKVYQYAFNLFETASFVKGDFALSLLVQPVLSEETTLCEGDRPDGTGVLVKPDTPPERITAIIEIVRRQYPKHKLRIYRAEQGKKTWTRI